MGGIVKGVGNALGFGGGASEAAKYNQDPSAYSELYQDAVDWIKQTGTDAKSKQLRSGLQDAAIARLNENSTLPEKRKNQFLQDQSRSFSADVQNLARAKGGTGTLAQVSRPTGAMYDAQARETARGLNDLYGQAQQDILANIGAAQGIQGDLYGQDLDRARSVGGLQTGEVASRRGAAAQNSENMANAEQAKYDRLGGTIQSAAMIPSLYRKK